MVSVTCSPAGIVEKYRKIILSKVVVGNKGSGEILAAKACAIEEVKAVIKAFDEANAYDLLQSIKYYETVLTEIEKL